MKPFNIAILSPSSPKDISAVVTVHAETVQAALKRVRNDPDMEGVRCYPIIISRETEH